MKLLENILNAETDLSLKMENKTLLNVKFFLTERCSTPNQTLLNPRNKNASSFKIL